MRVKLSKSAERDLRELRGYIATDNPAAADEVFGKLIKAFLLIRDNPEIGRWSNSKKYREWSVPSLPYVLPYVLKSEEIYIVRIYHTRRLKLAEW